MNFESPLINVLSFTALPDLICSAKAFFTLSLLNESETINISFNKDFKFVLLTVFLSKDSKIYSD